MSFGRELSPGQSGDFNFLDPNFLAALEDAENAHEDSSKLADIAHKLEHVYEQHIQGGLYFLCTGMTIKYDEYGHGVGEEYQEIYGTLNGFDVTESLGCKYLCAKIKEDDKPEPTTLLISTHDLCEAELVPDYPPAYDAVAQRRWSRIRSECFDVADFLATASGAIARLPLDSTRNDDLNSLERVLQEDRLFVGDQLAVAGSQAFKGDGVTPITDRPSFAGESYYNGVFTGLTMHEVQISPFRKAARLCIALELDDGSMVLQPCVSMYSADLVSA